MVVERGDPFKENIKKKCLELGVMAVRKSRRGGRKGGEGRSTHPQDCRARNRMLHGVRSHDQLHKQERTRSPLTDLISLTEWMPLNTMKF